MKRFYEKAARLADPCPKSNNGKHRFTGYRRQTCRHCGKEKP